MALRKKLIQLFRLVGDRFPGARTPKPAFDELAIVHQVMKEANQVLWVDNSDKTQSILLFGEYANIYGRPRVKMKENARDWMNAIHPEDRPEVEAALPLQLTGDFDLQYRVVHEDGAVRWVRDMALPIRHVDGSPAYLAGIVSDVTDRVELERQTRHDQKVKAVGALAGGICHDFNNVLAVIHGNMELSLDADLPDEVSENLRAVIAACERGATLTHRLLSYVRNQPLSTESISAKSFIESIGVLLKQTLTETVELEIISGAGLWNCVADRGELETVLLNLAINGRHAMMKDGKLTIEVNNTRIDEVYANSHDEVLPGQYVCFSVTDNGVGMTPDVVAQAFDPFFTTKEAGKGSGLGLSMAYGFAKQLRGHLKIYSEPGVGTTVKLYLPRAKDSEPKQFEGLSKLDPSVLKDKSVLLVDNDDDVRRTVELQLRAFGCRIKSTGNPEDAWSCISLGETFDLAVLDVVLGGNLSGPELAKRIEDALPEAKILFISGFTENGIIHDGVLDVGVTLVQKPFTKEELLAGCLRVLANSKK
ncbi:MAG: PAS domain-containing protein [Silicimonas sp.]|nr:PAS domain-containing protein [Silicimonas sp.]